MVELSDILQKRLVPQSQPGSFHAAGLPARRSRPESLPIVANGVFGARDVDTIAPLSSPKVATHEPTWAQAEPAIEVPTKKARRGLFGRKAPVGECNSRCDSSSAAVLASFATSSGMSCIEDGSSVAIAVLQVIPCAHASHITSVQP